MQIVCVKGDIEPTAIDPKAILQPRAEEDGMKVKIREMRPRMTDRAFSLSAKLSHLKFRHLIICPCLK